MQTKGEGKDIRGGGSSLSYHLRSFRPERRAAKDRVCLCTSQWAEEGAGVRCGGGDPVELWLRMDRAEVHRGGEEGKEAEDAVDRSRSDLVFFCGRPGTILQKDIYCVFSFRIRRCSTLRQSVKDKSTLKYLVYKISHERLG